MHHSDHQSQNSNHQSQNSNITIALNDPNLHLINVNKSFTHVIDINHSSYYLNFIHQQIFNNKSIHNDQIMVYNSYVVC